MKSKTIILSSQKKFSTNSPRAIITFISDNKQLEGKLRLYNLDDLPPASKLGIYYNEQVYTTNLIKKDGAFSFYLDENFNLDNNIYCAIIDRANKNDVVLCGGTSNGFVFETENNEENENIETEKIIDSEINKTDCANCKTCDNCIYKEYFFTHHKKEDDEKEENLIQNKKIEENINESQVEYANSESLLPQENTYEDIVLSNSDINSLSEQDNVTSENTVEITNNEELNNKTVIESSESEKFLKQITDQLDDMFKTYPEDSAIMQIIPNSKVIRVTDSFDESSYIVGVIYENGEINYLLYGVPAKYNDTPPKELGENYQWLPLNVDDPMSDGYFLIYQDATSGKIVPIKVE